MYQFLLEYSMRGAKFYVVTFSTSSRINMLRSSRDTRGKREDLAQLLEDFEVLDIQHNLRSSA